MSTRAKITFGSSILFTIGIISGVHLMQTNDESVRRSGIIIADERRSELRIANEREEKEQRELGEVLAREQGSKKSD